MVQGPYRDTQVSLVSPDVVAFLKTPEIPTDQTDKILVLWK